MGGPEMVVDRWRTAEGQELTDAVFARLAAGRELDDLELDSWEGRVDLRGIVAPLARRLARYETEGWFVEQLGDLITLRESRLVGMDFSGARLRSLRLHNVHLEDCRFDGADCSDWRLWGTDATGCTFRGANLRGASLGTWVGGARNTWIRTDFTQADLRGGPMWAAAIEDCQFIDAKLPDFEQCAIKGCRFAGAIEDVLFDGRELSSRPAPPEMEGVDFSDARFTRVEFRGFRLNDVRLPDDPSLRVVQRARCVASLGLEELEEDGNDAARKLRSIFKVWGRGPGTADEVRVVNLRDYEAIGGDELVRFAQPFLSHLEARCSSE